MKIKILVTSLLLLFVGTLCAQDYVRIKNRWKKDGRTAYKIHIENATVDAGAVKPNWWSAQWVFEKVPGTKYYSIRNRWKKDGKYDHYLDIYEGKLRVQRVRPHFKPSISRHWLLEKVPGTYYYRIKNRYRADHYLHIENRTLEAGRIKPNWWSAQWELEGFNHKKHQDSKKKKNKQRKIRVKLDKILCTLSDDEGAFNDADMDIFRLSVKPIYDRNACKTSKTNLRARTIYNWNGPEKEFKKGQTHNIGRNVYSDIMFNSDCNIGGFSLELKGYAREQDNGSASADEEAYKTVLLKGNRMFGTHTLRLKSSDFIFEYRITIFKVGW